MSQEILLPISQGATYFAALKESFQHEFEVCTKHHWGTVTDCAAISKKFDVGMLIFPDTLQTLQNGNTQCLVNAHAMKEIMHT